MATEIWAPVGERFVRHPICGHSFKLKSARRGSSDLPRCLVCGSLQREGSERAAGNPFDCVPSENLKWEGASIKKEVVLDDFSMDALPQMTLESLVALLSSANLSRVDLTGQVLRSQHSAHRSDSFSVWRAHTRGSLITAGTVTLPPGAMLIMAGHGASFRDTAFRATSNAASSAAIVCAGADFAGTFQNCTFDRCAVHVVHGAAVTLRGCTFRRCSPGFVGSGGATSATLHSCLLQSCPMAVIVEKGAAVHAVACRIHDAHVGAAVHDAGSHAAFVDCVMQGRLASVFGVALWGGGAHLSGCGLRAFFTGLQAEGPEARIEAHDSSFEGCRVAVAVLGRARGLLREVGVDDAKSVGSFDSFLPAVKLGGSNEGEGGPGVQMERCSVRTAHRCGVDVGCGGRAALTLCALRCHDRAVTVGDPDGSAAMLRCDVRGGSVCCLAGSARCRLRAQGCTLTGADSACTVLEGAVAVLVDTELRGVATGKTEGVVRVHDSTARLLRCAVKDSVTAVRVNGGTVTARDTHVTNTFPRMVKSEDPRAPPNPGAAYSCPTGSLTVAGGSVKGCGVGFWVGAVHVDTQQATLSGTVRVRGVLFEGYGSAFQVMSGSTVEIDDCEFWGRDCEDAAARVSQTRGPNGERDFEVQAAIRFTKARGTVRGCRFVGNKGDIAGEVAGTLRVARCTFKHRYMVDLTSAPSAPDSFRYASVAVRGEIDIDGCSFSNVEIGVSGLGRDGAVRRCSFTQVCSAVTVMDGCGMKVVDCKADNCIQACVASRRSTLAVQDFECDTLGGFLISYGCGAVVTAKRVTVLARVRAFEILSEGGPATEVKLVDCNLTAQEAAVLLQGVGVHASILHCTLTAAGTGLLLNAPASARLRKSAVRGCQVGLHVGDDPHFSDGPCWACGVRSISQRAQQAALAARVSGGKPGSKQRCPHEGGVARLTVSESAVYGCPFGMYIRTHGHVDAVGLHLEDCGRPVVELHHGEHEMSTFSDCTFCSCREFARREDERAPGDWIAGERIPGIRQVFEAPAGSESD